MKSFYRHAFFRFHTIAVIQSEATPIFFLKDAFSCSCSRNFITIWYTLMLAKSCTTHFLSRKNVPRGILSYQEFLSQLHKASTPADTMRLAEKIHTTLIFSEDLYMGTIYLHTILLAVVQKAMTATFSQKFKWLSLYLPIWRIALQMGIYPTIRDHEIPPRDIGEVLHLLHTHEPSACCFPLSYKEILHEWSKPHSPHWYAYLENTKLPKEWGEAT